MPTARVESDTSTDSAGQLAVEMAQGCSKAEWPHRGLRPLSPWQRQLPMSSRPVTGNFIGRDLCSALQGLGGQGLAFLLHQKNNKIKKWIIAVLQALTQYLCLPALLASISYPNESMGTLSQ